MTKYRQSGPEFFPYDWRNNSVLFLHNLHDQPREILLDPGVNRAEGKLLVNLLAEDHSRANESGKHRIVLEGHGRSIPARAAWAD